MLGHLHSAALVGPCQPSYSIRFNSIRFDSFRHDSILFCSRGMRGEIWKFPPPGLGLVSFCSRLISQPSGSVCQQLVRYQGPTPCDFPPFPYLQSLPEWLPLALSPLPTLREMLAQLCSQIMSWATLWSWPYCWGFAGARGSPSSLSITLLFQLFTPYRASLCPCALFIWKGFPWSSPWALCPIQPCWAKLQGQIHASG